MKTSKRLAALAAVAALGAVPALALGDGMSAGASSTVATGPPTSVTTGPPSPVTTGPPTSVTTGPPSTTPPSNQGTAHKPSTPGPRGGFPTQAKAYGYYCQKEPGSPDRTRTSGQTGTAFSKCVTAMSDLATGKIKSPNAACRSESKRPLAARRRSAFSLCVSAGRKLLRHQHKG